MNLKVPAAILTPWLRIFEHRVKSCFRELEQTSSFVAKLSLQVFLTCFFQFPRKSYTLTYACFYLSSSVLICSPYSYVKLITMVTRWQSRL